LEKGDGGYAFSLVQGGGGCLVVVYVFVFVANSELCETEGPRDLLEFLFGICDDAAAADRKTELIR